MWKGIFSFLVIIVTACGTVNCHTVISTHYEEPRSYSENPQCVPSLLNEGIQCSAFGTGIELEGGLYDNPVLFYTPLASAYFVARFADAWGFQDHCLTNTTFLRKMNMIAPWGGAELPVAIDCACGYKRMIQERCTFPDAENPFFFCNGAEGNPGTYGKRLGALTYITLLQDTKEFKWTLFANCWRDNANSVEIGTSFNVYSTESKLSESDRELIIRELIRQGFNTDPTNLIEFDYSITDC